MKKTYPLLLALIFSLSLFKSYGQKEAWIWYFGNQAGVTFASGNPVALSNSAMNAGEGCASISDPNGNLLFYTDGIRVYNKNHLQMPNGFGLMGNPSSTQSGVIVKKPGSTTIYYVFTVDATNGPGGFRYSEVDLTLNGGLGDVTTKNNLLWGSTCEKCTAVLHCNGTDVWVISHDWNSNQFRVHLVTATGVSATPVLTSVGSNHTGNVANTLGQLKASSDGKKIGYPTYTGLFAEVLDFNNSTGIPSNPMTFALPTGSYGFEFSPDNKLFYVGVINSSAIWQYNMCAGDGSQTAVGASSVQIGTGLSNVGALQLGPDKKIYFVRSGANAMGVINNPNVVGAGCNLVNNAISLGTKTSVWGLPNFITSYFGDPIASFTSTISCLTGAFTAPQGTISLSGCSGGTFAINSYSWNFGDPASGSANTSNLANPSHTFSAAGTYTVKLAIPMPCGVDTLKQVISTNFPQINIIPFPNTTLTCVNPSITLTGTCTNGMNLNFSWSSSCTNGTGPAITVTTPCVYTLTGTEPSSGCTTTTSIQIYENKVFPTASVSPTSGMLACGATPTTFTGSPNGIGYSTQWFTPCGGAPLAGYICLPACPGTYTFEVTEDATGCKSIYQVPVTSNNGIPELTVTATSNHYTINCVKCVTLQVQGVINGGVGTAITSWQNSTMTSTLSSNPTYSTCTPGNIIAYAYNSAAPNCTVAVMVTVFEDKVAPTAGFYHDINPFTTQTPTVNCYNPCVVLTGTSTVSNYTVAWLPQGGGSVPDPTFQVCANTNTATTTLSTPTVQITNQINGCTTKVAVPVLQNIRTVGLRGSASPSVLTCNLIQSQLNFTPTPSNAQITSTWTSPPPSNTYPFNPLSVYAPGEYTVEVTDVTNGCKSYTTVVLGLNILPPATVALSDATLACGSNTAQIFAGVTPTTGHTFFWDGPSGSTITPITAANPSVTMLGTYTVLIKNTATGCETNNSINVVAGTLKAAFIADPEEGFSPLLVNFTNNTVPSGGSTYWGYGNGTTQSSTTTINGSTTYGSPGTYTVVLISKKGICEDTAMAVIKVDIPSKMEVPNVFTPNGDGVNDFFILHTANLTNINASIYDRWGVKMYETTTATGNISWDGKNLAGQPVPAGVYFWIIKATGKDGKEFNDKGNVTLFVK